jgi:molybdopterin-synthase adenylyltransferase
VNAGVQLRIPCHLWGPLWDELRQSAAHEPVLFGLVSHGRTSDGTLVLVRDLIVPPATAFMRVSGHATKWSGAYNIELLNEALERGLGIVILHYHPGTAPVRMSRDDEQSARQLLPAFQMVVPGRPHVSVVLGETSISGLVLLPGTSALIHNFQLRFFTDGVTTFPPPEASARDLQLHRGRPLVDGVVSRSLVRNMSVAVVGLSGGGTQVATQLAGLGVGEIIGIDTQRVTRDNLLATDDFGWADVSLRRRKTAVVRSKVWWINRHVRFTALDALVPQKAAIEALKRADVIVGCVNNLNARADIQEIAWRYCIPYVDIGLGLHPLDPDDELSEVAAISGNVFAAVPGGACLWCTGFLTEEKLQLEAGGAGRSYLRTNLAARSKRDSAAYVASFNGALAGLAVSDVLQLILGYAPPLPVRKQYDGLKGTVSEVVVQKNQNCPKCSSVLAAGDPLWR